MRIVAEILMSLIFPCRWFLSHAPLFRARSARELVDNLALKASGFVSGDIDEDKIEPFLHCLGNNCL